uniref:Fibulin 2 n=1 Tax=Salmo trutta TaxID=8032 RepID=A0A673Z4P0_SALTR
MKMNQEKVMLFQCVLLLCLGTCLSQRDCTGVDCPVLDNCIEEVLEKGACCATCIKIGCSCEGYQYYDCIHAGFRNGKVPEGESYFVDFGSTECSCPHGGGRIGCHFIPCPEIPPNCITVVEPADGCPQCESIGCVQGNQKYEAGHSFQMDPCQVCHCPNDGGSLMCSPISDCDPRNIKKPMLATTRQNNNPLRDLSKPHDNKQTSPLDPFSESLRLTCPMVISSLSFITFFSFHVFPLKHCLSVCVSVVSSKELVEICCETGEKWASANGHCKNMELPREDRHSICRTAQRQCCLGSLKESHCFSGMNAAREGTVCEVDNNDQCGADSYKECCNCCSLGLRFHSEGYRCEAHQYLGYPCSHVFLTCCEGEEGEVRLLVTVLSPCPVVSDTPFPKEAFSIGEEEEQERENTVEGPPEMEDVDECQVYQSTLCHHRCINTPGSFRCACYPGYVLQQDAASCLPGKIKLLVAGNSHCMQQCSSVAGRPHCSCFPGFSLMADGQSCEDINECLMSTHTCQMNEHCVNTAGSFVCQRQITCPLGYKISNDVCEDIDECVQGTHNCGPGFECVNSEGSFRCNAKPHCSMGFTQDTHGNCIDIDECGVVGQPCSRGFNCINTVGSYSCQMKIIMCNRGYHASPDGARCIDVDECQSALHRCGEGQICHNLPGSYRCDCQTGYQYDMFRKMCVDVNECWRYPGRLCDQTCENTPGSYQCSCTAGFSLSSDGKNCEDVNECLSNPCSQECANIYGSYQCYCRQGYYLREDGHTCDDIDECAQSIGHLCSFKCVNVPGSYQCACPDYGYTMSPSGRACRDIDECTIGAHNCSLAETCYNIQGGFRCLSFDCPQNYRKSSDTRCERLSCPNFLDCQNSPLRITYYHLSFQTNIVIPAQIFRIGPSPAYSGDNVIISITQGNEENYFSTRKLNAYTGAVYLHRQVHEPRDFLIDVEMKLWRQGTFTTFLARLYVFITANSL